MIKFNLYNVTNGAAKARVQYSLDNHVSGLPNVTIYAKDCGAPMKSIFGGEVENNTNTQEDYFENGTVRLFEGHPLYAAARKTAEAIEAKNRARWAA